MTGQEEALFSKAMEAVKSGQDINIVARAYKIPRYYLEGEPLPEHYFDEPPIDEITPCPYDWMGMVSFDVICPILHTSHKE